MTDDDEKRSPARVALHVATSFCFVALASGLAFFCLVFILSVLKLAWKIAP